MCGTTSPLSFLESLIWNPFCHSALPYLSFPRHISVIQSDCGNPGSISFSNVREKNNIDSCLKISRITENKNNKEKERKHWIPNQVGDDIGVVFEDDIGVVFEDDN